MKQIEVIKFKRDTAFRKDFFIPDSFAHPAKMDAQLCLWITERYTKPGDVILDPMAGMGTQMLACTIGRDVVLVELEDKFCDMCYQNWQIVRMKPQLGYEMGTCQIIQGDARNLEGLLADAIVTSPPYAETGASGPSRSPFWERLAKDPTSARFGRGSHPSIGEGYSPNNKNIGNLPYGSIDSIVTSPPYEEAMSGGGIAKYGHYMDPNLAGRVYSAENMNIERQKRRVEKGLAKMQRPDVFTSEGNKAAKGYFEGKYSVEVDNIGNLKGETYLQAMLQIYQQCHKVLKPNGLMILVLKNFIRNKQVVRLDLDTIKLCEQAGFEFKERFYRKLPSQSFWRIIYHQKYPQVKQIEYEDVIAVRRL